MIRTARFIVVLVATAAFPIAYAHAEENGARPQPSIVEDGQVKLRVTMSKTEARVADPVEITLEVEAPPKMRVELPKVEQRLGDFDVRASEQFKDIPSGTAAGTRLSVLRMTLDTIKTGDLTVPPLDVQYSAADQAAQLTTLSTKPLSIHITSVLENRADSTKFRDIKQTIDVAVPVQPSYAWVGWSAAGIGAALASVLLVALAKRRRRGPTPAQWALASIDDVAKLKLETPDDAHAVINEVVDIVREFFGLQFNVPSLSRTSRELVAQATKRVYLNKPAVESLVWLVALADEIKFAQLGIGEKQAREAIERAKAFVAECEQHRQFSEKGAA